MLRNYLRRAADPMSEVRGVRAFKCIVDPCHLTALRVHSMETDGSGRTFNDRGIDGRGARAGAAGLLLGRRICSSTTTIRARRRSSRRRSAAGRTCGQVAASTSARCAAPSRTSRPTRSRTGRRSTTWRGSGGSRAEPSSIVATYENPRALGLCLASVARQARAARSIAIADDGSGPGDEGRGRRLRARSPRCRCGTSGTRTAASRRTPS